MNGRELEAAFQRLLDGTLPPEDLAALNAALKEDPDRVETYLDCVELHMMLADQAGSRRVKSPFPGLIETKVRQLQRRTLRTSLLAAAAAFVLLGLILRLTQVPPEPPLLTFRTTPDTLLVVDHPGGDDAPPRPDALDVGSRVTLRQGVAELAFASGVRAIIKAPADLTVRAADFIELRRGEGWFEVPTEAVGFTVQTEELRVTDLGTEFGVLSLADAADEVHVLTGRVEAEGRHGLRARETLAAGQARACDPVGRLDPTPVRGDRFLTTLPASLPHLHWSFDGEDPLQVAGTLPAARSTTTRTLDKDASLPGQRRVAGKRGGALLFGGPGDEITTNWRGFEGRAARTFACWIKLQPGAPERLSSIVEWGHESQNHFWRVRVAPGNDASGNPAVLRVAYGVNWVDGETQLADGNWHHVAVVETEALDASGFPVLRLYVDGNEENLTYLPRARATAAIETRPGLPLTIGRAYPQGGSLRGTIDELFLFEGALPLSSIRELMNHHRPAARQ
jgi:hypothetical protein